MCQLSVRGSARGERAAGASATEFVLLLPVLVTLLFGMISGGILLYQYIGISDAARQATRFGATYEVTDEAAWTSAVTSHLIANAKDDPLDANPLDTMCVVLLDDPGDVPCFDDGLLAAFPVPVRVQVAATRDETWSAVFWSETITLRGRSVARYELETGP